MFTPMATCFLGHEALHTFVSQHREGDRSQDQKPQEHFFLSSHSNSHIHTQPLYPTSSCGGLTDPDPISQPSNLASHASKLASQSSQRTPKARTSHSQWFNEQRCTTDGSMEQDARDRWVNGRRGCMHVRDVGNGDTWRGSWVGDGILGLVIPGWGNVGAMLVGSWGREAGEKPGRERHGHDSSALCSLLSALASFCLYLCLCPLPRASVYLSPLLIL